MAGFSLGKAAFDRKDYSGALGYLNLAKGFMDTEEVKALISETQQKLKGE